MVFVTDPYYNEPGYERNTHGARQAATSYNQDIRVHTARHAILEALQQPDPMFKEALQLHYHLRGPAVLEMLQRWVEQAGAERENLKSLMSQVGPPEGCILHCLQRKLDTIRCAGPCNAQR